MWLPQEFHPRVWFVSSSGCAMCWIACINAASPQPVAVLEKIFGAWTAQGIAAAAELKVADALAAGHQLLGG